MNTEWCTFRRGSKENSSIQDCFSPEVSKSRTIQMHGWSPIEKSLSEDVDRFLSELDKVIFAKFRDDYFEAAYHLCLQKEVYPKFPTAIVEGIPDNRDIWIDGIKQLIAEYSGSRVVYITPNSDQKLQDVVDEIRSTPQDVFSILILDEQSLQRIDFNKLLHLLKFFKRNVSVLVQTIAVKMFEEQCSFRTLNQMEPLILRMCKGEELLKVIFSYITIGNTQVLQFSPYILQFIRKRFMLVDGSIETAKNILKFAMINHTAENIFWSYEDSSDFSHLSHCYWQMTKYLAGELNIPTLDFHEMIQSDGQSPKNTNDLDKAISGFVSSLSRSQFSTVATYLLAICRSKDCAAVNSLNITRHYGQLQKYQLRLRNRVPVEESTMIAMSNQIEKLFLTFLRPFLKFPNGRSFVVNTRSVEALFSDPQLTMERSLVNKDNSCSRCYRALRESGKWNRISLNEWAKAFYKIAGCSDSAENKLEFCMAVYTLERCGIVGASASTPKGYADICYQSRRND